MNFADMSDKAQKHWIEWANSHDWQMPYPAYMNARGLMTVPQKCPETGQTYNELFATTGELYGWAGY